MPRLLQTALFMCLILTTACTDTFQSSYIQPDKIGRSTRLVAVLPLVNLTSHPNAGRIVGDILATELYRVEQFQFIERTQMEGAIRGDAGELEFVMDKAVARDLGTKLGVDTVIYGSVSEYLYQRGIDQSPAVGVNLRMLDVTTGEVLWAASMSETDSCFVCDNNSLNLLTQTVCHEMVNQMLASLGYVSP